MKKIVFMFSAVVAILAFMVPISHAAESTLIGDWKLNEGEGDFVKDSSGNANNGTYSGKWIKGDFGAAILLQGNFVKFPTQPSLQVGTSDFTIEGWVLPQKLEFDKSKKTLRIISSVGSDRFFVVDLGNGGKPQLTLGLKKNGAWMYANVTAKQKIKLGKWSHLAVVCDRKTMTLKVYINGIKDAEKPLPAAFKNVDLKTPLTIGSAWHGFVGGISDVILSRDAQSDAQIKTHYENKASQKIETAFKSVSLPDPLITPHTNLYAEFIQNTKCPVFQYDETAQLWVKMEGHRKYARDTLVWSVLDWAGNLMDQGNISVLANGNGNWKGTIKLSHYGSGYFQVYLKLKKADIYLLKAGTMPQGFVTYSVLPDIQRLPLKHADDARFGAQGYSNTKPDGKYRTYDLGGMKWAYRYRWLYNLEEKGPNTFKPVLDPIKAKQLMPLEARSELCLIVEASSLPPWLTKVPKGMDTKNWSRSPSNHWSAYPPSDYQKYEDLIGRVAAEQALLKKTSFPKQAKNYYEIHWEPDWHWKGSDEDFIKMYQHARIAIRRNDPDGLLLGPNYGVIADGNKHLKRLFAKGLGKYLDGVMTHTYYLPMMLRSPEQAGLIKDMRALTAMTKKYLPSNAPIINSEWGVDCKSYFGVDPLNDPDILRKEAAWFIRGHAIALGEGAQTTFFFYAVDHSGFGMFFNRTYPYPGFGATHISPKPVFAAAATMTRLLDGTKNVCPIDYLGENTWGYVFDRAGSLLAMLWSKDDQTRVVSFPCDSDKIILYDPMGNQKEIKAINGVCRVTIGANPVYLENFSRAVVPSISTSTSIASNEVIVGETVAIHLEDKKNSQWVLHQGGAVISASTSNHLLFPNSLQPGKYLLSALDASGQFVSSQILTLKSPVKMTLSKEKKSATSNHSQDEIMVQLENLLDKEVQGKLQQQTSNDQNIETVSVKLSAHEVKRIVFKLHTPRLTSRGKINICFTDSNGVKIKTEFKTETQYLIPKVLKTPIIDGNLSEWNLESFQTVRDAKAMKINFPNWKGQNDLSFRFSIKYDAHALYAAFKVRDQTFCQQQKASNSWREDSVQLGVALGRQKKSWKLFHKFCFAKNSKTGKLLAYRHIGVKGLNPGPLDASKVKFAFSRVGDESFYEIAIPWNELDPHLTQAPLDRVLGLGVLVNDSDVGKYGVTPRKAMEAFGGMGSGFPSKLGVSILQ